MKKTVAAVLLFVVTLTLCSCSGSSFYDNAVAIFDSPYRATVRIAEGGEIFEAEVVRSEDGTLEISFLEPSLLCGISYGFDQDDGYIAYGGMSVKLEDGSAKDKVSRGVYVWRKMLEPEKDGITGRKIKDGEKTYAVISDGQTEYKIDAKTGAPLLATYGETVISFTEFEKYAELPEGTG